MPISKTIVTPNGMVQVSRVEQAILKRKLSAAGDGSMETVFEVHVNMYGSLEDAKRNTGIVWQEYPTITVPQFETGSEPFAVVEQALIDNTERFKGGTFTPMVEVTSLDSAKAIKWEQIKALRKVKEDSGFTIDGIGKFDSDKESRDKIVGAALAAKIASDASQPYLANWTLADNSVVPMDAAAAISLGFKLLAHLDSIHQRSRVLYGEIQAATTKEEVEAIQWDVAPATEVPTEGGAA